MNRPKLGVCSIVILIASYILALQVELKGGGFIDFWQGLAAMIFFGIGTALAVITLVSEDL